MQDMEKTDYKQQVSLVSQSKDAGSTQEEHEELLYDNEADTVTQKKGFSFIYLFPLLYVATVYGMFILGFSGSEKMSTFIIDHFIFILAGFGVVNALVAIVYCKPENRNRLFYSVVFMKYTLIPFYLIGGLIPAFGLLMTFIPVPFMIFLGPAIAVTSGAMGWFALAVQSPYMIAYLRLAARENEMIDKWKVVHIILQFIFVTDVIDVMVLTFIEKKCRKLTIAVCILLAAAFFILCAIVVLGILGIGILAFSE